VAIGGAEAVGIISASVGSVSTLPLKLVSLGGSRDPIERGPRKQSVETETPRNGFEEMPQNRKTDRLGTCGNAPNARQTEGAWPRGEFGETPPTYSEASKKKNLNDFFPRQGNWGERICLPRGGGPPDIAPHKLRGPRKGKSEKQEKLGLRTQKRA